MNLHIYFFVNLLISVRSLGREVTSVLFAANTQCILHSAQDESGMNQVTALTHTGAAQRTAEPSTPSLRQRGLLVAVWRAPRRRSLVEDAAEEVETWQQTTGQTSMTEVLKGKHSTGISSPNFRTKAQDRGWLGSTRQEGSPPGKFSPAWKSQLLAPTFGRAGTGTHEHTHMHTQVHTHIHVHTQRELWKQQCAHGFSSFPAVGLMRK